MKKCILVWQVPVIEGEPYNPVEYAVVKKYYLEYMEYNSAQIENVAEFLSE